VSLWLAGKFHSQIYGRRQKMNVREGDKVLKKKGKVADWVFPNGMERGIHILLAKSRDLLAKNGIL
jgi:hypothetical protein